VWLYNVGGRPVFPEPISGALFCLGLLVALWNWRQPAHALVLLWLPASLLPAAVSWPAPNFVRALGAMPVTFIFPAIAVTTMAKTLRHEKIRLAICALLLALLAGNASLTAHDYFEVWPRNAEVRWLYQATWTQAARWLDIRSDTTPVAVSGSKIHDLDPQTFDILLRRRDVKVKWFDCRTSILLSSSGTMRYVSPDFFPCDVELWNRFLGKAQLVTQPHWPDTNAIIFTAHQDLSGRGLPSLYAFGPLSLTSSEITRQAITPGGEAELLTFWRVTGPVPAPIKIFVHVVSDDGKPLAQWDGFDFGEAQLEPDDQLVERHRFTVPPNVAPGTYRVVVGVYNPATMKRLTLSNGDDQVLLKTIMVQ
jgi:hypothetical protein